QIVLNPVTTHAFPRTSDAFRKPRPPSPPSRDTGLWPGHRRPGIRLPRRSWITSAASTESQAAKTRQPVAPRSPTSTPATPYSGRCPSCNSRFTLRTRRPIVVATQATSPDILRH
ncbi:hypothetical protein TGDOM2_401550, partial [Toxoplasma gondii GAB2-2007-GAL-DOM2]